jgi:ubiquitin carboxyl-terminal hydrolase 1
LLEAAKWCGGHLNTCNELCNFFFFFFFFCFFKNLLAFLEKLRVTLLRFLRCPLRLSNSFGMNFHPESAFANSRPTPSSQLIVPIVVTVVTCLGLTFLDAWPYKRHLWELFVRLIPSQFIYAMEYPSRRRWREGQGNVGFRRSDFGNYQAKSEALQRVWGFDNSITTVVQRARRLSGLDHVLGPSRIAPAGLGNWDNSCYQNSVIQSLSSLPSFDDYLAQNVERISQEKARSTHDALRNIIGRLNHIDNEGRRLWTPPALKSMNSWQQQDAQEYFSRIIDEVDKEISKVAHETSNELGFQRAGDDGTPRKIWQHNPLQGLLAQRVGCIRCGYTEGLLLLPFTCITVSLGMERGYDVRDCLDEYTALESIEGVECIKCTVLRNKSSLELVLRNLQMHDASRPVQADVGPVSTLRETVAERLQAINEVCEASDFSDSGVYKKCNILAKARVSSTKSKQAVIARAPKDLVIHVNRSIFDPSGFQRKNHARVHFPVDLDISQWCLGSGSVKAGSELLENWNTSPAESMLPQPEAEHLEAGKKYKLRSVITHYGAHENGHYIAYRRRWSSTNEHTKGSLDAQNPDDSWFCFSDEVVSPVSEDYVLSQGGVFMLFYEAVNKTESSPEIPAQVLVDEVTVAAQQAAPFASHEEGVDSSPTASSLETGNADFELARSTQDMVLSSKIDTPPERSSPSSEVSTSPEHPRSQANDDVQPEAAWRASVTPVMRTAGARSPNSRIGRRSSNISLHSPSFITAS